MVKLRFDGVAIDEAGFCEVVRDAWLVAVDAAFFGLGVAKLLFHVWWQIYAHQRLQVSNLKGTSISGIPCIWAYAHPSAFHASPVNQ